MTPSASEIMIAQSGESVGDYALKETKLIYETIESPDAYSQAVTECSDTDFPFEDINYLRPTNWGKDHTDAVEAINIPRRSMRAIVIIIVQIQGHRRQRGVCVFQHLESGCYH
jgi:hypothetical protein